MNDALREALTIGLAYTRGAVHELREEGASQSEIDEANADVRKIEAAIAGLPAELPDYSESQNWAKTSPAIAWHLIDRHGDNWREIGAMMEAWARAWVPANTIEQQAQPYNQFGTDY